jgi:isoleucyl-tRNA synthetase
MSSLPPALNFAETEEGIVKKWKEEKSFQLQNELSIERGDEVSSRFRRWFCFSIERCF